MRGFPALTLVCAVFLGILLSVADSFLINYSVQAADFPLSSYLCNILEADSAKACITAENFKNLPYRIEGGVNAKTVSDVAWRTFVTLNWPSDSNGPLTDRRIGKAPNASRVWEFYKMPEEVFLLDAADPRLLPVNPLRNLLPVNLTKWTEFSNDRDFEHLLECFSKTGKYCDPSVLNEIPIVDQQGNYLLIENRLNFNEYSQIIDNQWYSPSRLADYNNEDSLFRLASSHTGNEVESPIEIKAIWRILETGEEAARYYTTHRILAIPRSQDADMYLAYIESSSEGDESSNDANNAGESLESCLTSDELLQRVEVGLIGFHISYKIPDQENDSPGWIWATFGHVDNASLLFNSSCVGQSCEPNIPYVRTPFLWRVQSPHAVTFADGHIQPQVPTQVVLNKQFEYQFDSRTKRALIKQNQIWQQALGSVWQYYELLGTQWLQDASYVNRFDPSLDWATIPEWIANHTKPGPLINVSEAYGQTQPKGTSCIECHAVAKLPSFQPDSQKVFADFSFLFGRIKP